MSTKFRPLSNRVLIKPQAAEEKSPGGIIIPGNAQEKPVRGTVVATGPGKVDANGIFQELRVKRGDVVLYGKYAGTEIKIDSDTHVIVTEDDVLGVLEEG